jgi:hypothetical protein
MLMLTQEILLHQRAPIHILHLSSSVNLRSLRIWSESMRQPSFFPAGDGRAPLYEQIPTLEADEVVMFRDFFTCRLRFPCDPILPAILDKFSVKVHQLSPRSFLELSKFFSVMKIFRCNFGAHMFAWLFELVIEKDIIKLDDGQYYEAHYTCCTFNVRRQNTRKGLTWI